MAVMKAWTMKATARTLLVAYVLFLLKPAMPVLMDKLAHTFWENVHIAVVHRINGKEHVHYELRKAAAGSEKDKSGATHKSGTEEAYALAVMQLRHSTLHFVRLAAKPAVYYLRTHIDVAGKIEAPPPRQA